ncbi:MAG: S8 family serine peptidase [Candidatus Odinarchaeota archaeon]
MIRLKKQRNLFVISLIFISYFLIPLTGIQLNYSNNSFQTEKYINNLGSLHSSLISESNNNKTNLNQYTKTKYSKFDSSLDEYLTNLTLNQSENKELLQIIILFENSINKEGRIDILKSIFNNYIIVRNYDIIPGIYVKISPTELINNRNVIDGIKSIKKIYKSKLYQNPYILEQNPQTSALNFGDYPNWWVPAVGAENISYDGSGVKVAVIDTGIYNHPDLDIINNSNFVTDESPTDYNDDVGHGTHVGGIIAGNGGISSGKYRGIAPGALLINARAGNASGLSDFDIISAIEWSSTPTNLGGAGADIVSMSFGGGYPIISDLISEAISNAKKLYGVIFVASAGNSGPEYFTGSTPASGIDVIAVGATNKNGELASFSSWGPTYRYLGYPDVVAPGVYIISTEAPNSIISEEERYIGDLFNYPGNADYIPLSGTSMACPMVSGALAILLQAYPSITPETARIALKEGAKKLINKNDGDLLKSGAGLINVSASLEYLNNLNHTIPDINDIVKFYPGELPVKPYDLLHFPGDKQKFNLTVISGKNNTYNVEIPNNVQGISISSDKTTINFSQSGISFLELEFEINRDSIPEIKTFQINLTVGGEIYDSVNVVLDIRLPEYKILMESYHGLNDWFPEVSNFYQIGFYEAMADLSDLNISIDYNMEHWTPDYNKSLNNSILTRERLAQYDVIFLQNPMLPYSNLEIRNLQDYFDEGGNLFFLGTRYQDLALENINYLFSKLGVDIQINEENIMNDNWLGIGTSVSSQNVSDFNNPALFNGVNNIFWSYGNSFTVSGNAESIATIDNKTVVALYNGTSQAKGNLVAIGDLHWLYYDYISTTNSPDHLNFLRNLMEFFLKKENAAINIDLKSDRISNSKLDLSIYLKNQTTESPIKPADFTSLEVTIRNSTTSKLIILNTSFSDSGIYFNNSYNLPYSSYLPYDIIVNLTIGSSIYNKVTKILYFDNNKVPKILDLSSVDKSITRSPGDSTSLIAQLDAPTYGNINGYLSIFPHSFYNSKKLVNRTLIFSHQGLNTYSNNFDPTTSDPSGYGIYYIVPLNSNYTNPNSPRSVFEIINHPPEILKTTSTFNKAGYNDISFDETKSSEGSYVYSTNQGDKFNFAVDVRDSVNYEDSSSDMRVFVDLFICSVSDNNYIFLIFPHTIEVSELNYKSASGKFEGSFIIPDTLRYTSIAGIKSISTATGFNPTTNEGYLGILYITVYDSEGGTDDFLIVLTISERPFDFSLIIIIVLSIVALLGVVSFIVYYSRRKRYPRTTQIQPVYDEYYYEPSYEEPRRETTVIPESIGPSFYCPFCGHSIKVPKKFCPNCGESLEFFQQKE